MGKLLVIGSLNMDMTIYVEEAPKRGETVYGHDFLLSPGGKGANQAVAAARLGAQVAMLGRVGDDLFGKSQIEGLQKDGIDTRSVLTTQGVSTGVACIQVVKGDNSIVLDLGANDRLTPEDIEAHRDVMAACDAVMLQFEIPMDTIHRTIAMAHELGKKIILTPAPVVPFEESLLEGIYLLLPNEHEAQRITGIPTGTLEDAQRALTALADKGVAHPL
ncbi:MAG TPA: ribokinase, partial [Clostridia bacterium]|nr:ribokinase [Clostridia bacterium]